MFSIISGTLLTRNLIETLKRRLEAKSLKRKLSPTCSIRKLTWTNTEFSTTNKPFNVSYSGMKDDRVHK